MALENGALAGLLEILALGNGAVTLGNGTLAFGIVTLARGLATLIFEHRYPDARDHHPNIRAPLS